MPRSGRVPYTHANINRGDSFVVDDRDVGAEMRRLRLERGLSLSDLARRVNYSTSYLSRIETGRKGSPWRSLALLMKPWGPAAHWPISLPVSRTNDRTTTHRNQPTIAPIQD